MVLSQFDHPMESALEPGAIGVAVGVAALLLGVLIYQASRASFRPGAATTFVAAR